MIDKKIKSKIDNMSFEELFFSLRASPIGHYLWQGKVGKYAMHRFHQLKKTVSRSDYVKISKSIG